MKSTLLAATLLLFTLLPVSIAAEKPDKETLKAELVRMEQEFCAMAKDKGILAAFEHFAAPDAAFFGPDPRKVRGVAAVRERMGPDRPGVTVTWTPTFTDVSDDGTLGYNYGRYEWRGPGPDGKAESRTGWFLTIWKRQPNGTWRYVLDDGTPDPKPTTTK